MSSEIKNTAASVFEVTTTVSGEKWSDAKNKALKKLASQVSAKGFRKGKVPFDIAKKSISEQAIVEEAIHGSLNEAYAEVISEHKLHPYLQPEVQITKVDADGYTVVFTITVAPEVELGQYKDLNVAMGDTVIFDFKGYINGKEFEGGSADNYSLVLGSNQFIPGFEDQLVGATPDSKKDVLVTFPEQYVKELAGKDAKFVCMIHEIKTKVLPELTDEYVAELGGNAKTVAEYRSEVEATLRKEKEQAAREEQMNTIISKIIASSKVTIGEKVLEAYAQNEKENLIKNIEQNGISYEQYQEITGMNDAKIVENLKEQAAKNITESLVMNEIARKENLIISKAELNEYYAQVAKQYNMTVEEVEKAFGNNTQNIVNNLLGGKLNRFLVANNTPEAKTEEKATATEEKPAKEKAAPKAKKTTAKKTTKKAEVKEETEAQKAE